MAATTRKPTMVYEEPQRPAGSAGRAAPREGPRYGEIGWMAASAGVAVLALGMVTWYVFLLGRDVPAQTITLATFYTIGVALVVLGLAAASAFARTVPWGGRVALLLGAAFVATSGIYGNLLMMGMR